MLRLQYINNMRKEIKFLIGLILATTVAGGIVVYSLTNDSFGAPIKLENPSKVNWKKPTTDAQWAEDVKEESLHLKFNKQLDKMKVSHEDKLPRLQKDMDELMGCPECVRWDLRSQFEGMFDDAGLRYNQKLEGKNLQQWIDEEFDSASSTKHFEYEKLQQSIERIDNEIRLRDKGFVTVIDRIEAGKPERLAIDAKGGRTRSPLGTTFFIDADCGTPGDGTTATCNGDADDSFDDLDAFMSVARSAGDVAIARRSPTRMDDGTDVTVISDGTKINPIKVEADFTDEWGDFASSSQTYTPVLGSKVMEASATITGIVADDWIFVQGEDQFDFSYQVNTVSGTTLTLFLPYKGAQTGSGKTLNVMGIAPRWGNSSVNVEINFDADNHWKMQGLILAGSDVNGVVEIDGAHGHLFKDIIFQANSSDTGIEVTDDVGEIFVYKTHFDTGARAVETNAGASVMWLYMEDSLIDGTTIDFQDDGGSILQLYDTESTDTSAGTNIGGTMGASLIMTRDYFTPNDANGFTGVSGEYTQLFQEGEPLGLGINTRAWFSAFNTVLSTSTALRSGGGPVSMRIAPDSSHYGSEWEVSEIPLFEYPIFVASTTSQTYTMFFKADDNTDWDASPTETELWIECYFLANPDGQEIRVPKRSTGSVDFTTDTDFDQTLAVTCQAEEDGILYLRGWYFKALESGNSNIFFIDGTPVIS